MGGASWTKEWSDGWRWTILLRRCSRDPSLRLKTKAKREEIIAAWNSYRSEPQELKLPSAPERPIVYLEAPDRPQPRFDVDMGAGMTTAVGRLRPCGVLDWKFTVLSHNTIRGAAGAAVLNAELLKAKGYLG